MLVIVGRIGRPHGIKGEVAVQVRTDDPDVRFAPGSDLLTDPPSVGPLTVDSTRWHSGRLLVVFRGVADRSAAETLRGVRLLVDQPTDVRPADPDEFYDHQLIGLDAVDVDGQPAGVVEDVLHLPGQDVLTIRRPDGREVLVPFVGQLVPEVDLDAGRLVLDPPAGLLDPDEYAGP